MSAPIHTQTSFAAIRLQAFALLLTSLLAGCAGAARPAPLMELQPRLMVLDASSGLHLLLDATAPAANDLGRSYPMRLQRLLVPDFGAVQLNNVSIPRLLGSGSAGTTYMSSSPASKELHP